MVKHLWLCSTELFTCSLKIFDSNTRRIFLPFEIFQMETFCNASDETAALLLCIRDRRYYNTFKYINDNILMIIDFLMAT